MATGKPRKYTLELRTPNRSEFHAARRMASVRQQQLAYPAPGSLGTGPGDRARTLWARSTPGTGQSRPRPRRRTS